VPGKNTNLRKGGGGGGGKTNCILVHQGDERVQMRILGGETKVQRKALK